MNSGADAYETFTKGQVTGLKWTSEVPLSATSPCVEVVAAEAVTPNQRPRSKESGLGTAEGRSLQEVTRDLVDSQPVSPARHLAIAKGSGYTTHD
jgi:hypothetical protein